MADITLIVDLNNFYRNKLLNMTDDFADTAKRADVDIDDITAIIVRNLLGYAAFISIKYGANKEEFVETCSIIYDEMLKGKKRAMMEH